MSGKVVLDGGKALQMTTSDDHVIISYIPNLNFDFASLFAWLMQQYYTRVKYISQYGKPNSTPRLTWCWGHIEGHDINKPVKYRQLNFLPERMPPQLEALSQYIRACVIQNYGFDPQYNSVLIGRYENGNDTIGFHTDAETFLEHLFCANVSVGYEREFQFRDDRPETMAQNGGKPVTNEIKLRSGSVLFFSGVEHALPKRAHHDAQKGIRFSISFRKMGNDIGIGNTMYYCRGLDGAVNDELKVAYQEKLSKLQQEKALAAQGMGV